MTVDNVDFERKLPRTKRDIIYNNERVSSPQRYKDLNVSKPNSRALKFMQQTLTELRKNR